METIKIKLHFTFQIILQYIIISFPKNMSKQNSRLNLFDSSEWSQTFTELNVLIDISLSDKSDDSPRKNQFDLSHDLEKLRMRIARLSQNLKQYQKLYCQIRDLQMRQEDALTIL